MVILPLCLSLICFAIGKLLISSILTLTLSILIATRVLSSQNYPNCVQAMLWAGTMGGATLPVWMLLFR